MAHETLELHQRRQAHAASKIARQENRMTKAGSTPRQRVEDAQLMSEMRHNKSTVGLNRALFDIDVEAEKV